MDLKDDGYDVSDYYDIDPSFGTMADTERALTLQQSSAFRLSRQKPVVPELTNKLAHLLS